jgi:hypothetical protein
MNIQRTWVVALLLTIFTSCQPTSPAGAGFTDVSPRQLVRSEDGYLYAVVPTCSRYPDCAGAVLNAYRSRETLGTDDFLLLDPQHAPGAGAGSSAIAQDGTGRIHVLWVTRSGHAKTATIDTATDLWSAATELEATDWTDFGQGDAGVALVADAAGRPHAFWNRRIDGHLRIRYSVLEGATWSPPVTIDDVVQGDRRNAWHPTAAFAPDGTLWLAWLEGIGNYVDDGIIHVRTRAPNGIWRASQSIPGEAMTGIDNGPSMLVTGDGVVHLAFNDTGNLARYWYHDAAGWHGDRQPPETRSHNPSLGPDGKGGVFLYAHGTVPADDLAGHGDDLFTMRLPAGQATWGPWTRIVAGRFDCSVSTRWAQFHEPHPGLRDYAYWSDSYPNDLWIGMNIQ